MSPKEISFRIGGEAGQGVESSGAGFVTALARAGLQVLGIVSYYERIRGGHNFFTIRAVNQPEPVFSTREKVNVLIALNAETVTLHRDCMNPGGVIIVDETHIPPDLDTHGIRLVTLPLITLATEHGNPIMANTGALAAAAAVAGIDLAYLESVIEDNFGKRNAALAKANKAVARATHALTMERYGQILPPLGNNPQAPPRLSLTGNAAFAMGAIMGGCKFVAGYPMTPATSVLEYMAAHAADWGLVVKHAEDEIAAVNMCVGASWAGVRAMTPTSGGGFDLMTEGISLAAMTETPLVIYLAQRPGPATGLATRTAQADLLMALFSSHGEFPRFVTAPHTPEECFYAGWRAFNIAEKYQCPVIVLSDHLTATALHTRDKALFDPSQVVIDRGKLLSPEDLEGIQDYKRYAITEDGISPRALPGMSPHAVYLSSSNEHREDGHLTEDPAIVVSMVNKRLRKYQGLQQEVRPPLRYGPPEADLTLISWGSTHGAVREAVDLLNAAGTPANMVHLIDIWPFPTQATREALSNAKRLVAIEGNATGQMAYLIHAQTGISIPERILKYDGRAFTAEYILAHLEV